MRKVIVYACQDITTTAGVLKLNQLISEGWQPYGNPYMTSFNVVCQVVVKYEDVVAKDSLTAKKEIAEEEIRSGDEVWVKGVVDQEEDEEGDYRVYKY